MIRLYIIVAVICLMGSCASKQKSNSQVDEPSFFAGTFVVNILYDRPIEGDDLVIKIDDRLSQVSGFAACNTYSVAFTQDQKKITFSHIISTKVQCDDETMKKETTFLNIFTETKEYSIKGDALVIYNEGKEVLKATRFIF